MAASGGADPSCNPKLLSALSLLRDTYPFAQKAFVDLEVFENLMSRQVIKRFGYVFEILSDAACNSGDNIQRARSLLEGIALDSLQYLCGDRIRHINALDKRTRVFWYALMLRNPFKKSDVRALVDSALSTYAVGTDPSKTFVERAKALQASFVSLEQALAEIQPHNIYDRIFAVALRGICILVGVLLYVVLFR